MPAAGASGSLEAMKRLGEDIRGAPRARAGGDGELLGRLAAALDSGAVTAEDLERLLSRGRRETPGRPTATSVLYALGSVVVFCGLAIAYGTVFDDLPWAAQITTPFLFPLAALGGSIWLARRGFASWQSDLAGLVGYVALGAAFGVSAAASGWVHTEREAAAFAAAAALVAVAVVAAVHRAARSPRLLWVGMPAALAALGISAAELVGLLTPRTVGWVVLAEAGIAAVVAAVLAPRDRRACRYATLWATLGGYAAVAFSPDDLDRFRVWHVVLAGVVIAAFLAAAALDFDALIWIAAAGGAVWVVMIAVVVGSATGAALAVVLAGLGLAGLGLLVARLRRSPRLRRE
jgi:hypothetical protein